MDPFTIAFLATTAIGTVMSAVGKVDAGEQQAKADQSQAQTDQANAVAGHLDAQATRVSAGNSYTEADIADLQSQLYGVNAGIDSGNIDLAKTQAQIAAGGVELAYARERLAESRIADTGRITIAAQRTAASSGNLDDRTGSPLLTQAITASRVQSDVDLTRANGAIDAAVAKTNAANQQQNVVAAMGKSISDQFGQIGSLMRANSLRIQGQSLDLRATSQDVRANALDARAGSLTSKAGDDITAGYLGAATSLLSGATSMFGKVGGGGGGPDSSFSVGTQTFPSYG